MPTRERLIEAAVTGMHAKFPDTQLHKRAHEATISCDMLQFWLRDKPLGDRHYEITLSFLSEDVRHWERLAREQGVRHFDIQFHPASLWREMRAVLTSPSYVARHPKEGLEQLVNDLEEILALAKDALAEPAA